MLRLLPVLLLLLTGCSVLEGFNTDVNAVGRQIVADWKQRPEVAAARFEYRHGLDLDLDLGESMTVEVMVHADKIIESTLRDLVDIAKRDYRTGTGRRVDFRVLFTSAEQFRSSCPIRCASP
ncbi:hypothetical protein [Lentzea sp. NPDC004782]|uniref:hypothetical protein n=1 Tax=Lentzea sp. NPDC004782 TaxID=3154458 RepID=UPI0033A5B4A3